MSDVTRRELFGIAAVSALGAAASACTDSSTEAGGSASNGSPASASAASASQQGATAKPALKIAVQGLTAIHREYKVTGAGKTIVGLRLAPLDAKANGELELYDHVAIFAVPQMLLRSWTVAPLFTTMDYVFWGMKGWKAKMEITSGLTKYTVGKTTKLEQSSNDVTPHDCASVEGNWRNANMIVNFRDVGMLRPAAELNQNWQDSKFVAGYLELPYGAIESDKVNEGPHEEFDQRVWMFSGGGGVKRGLKNVVRIQLTDVDSASISVGSLGTIEFSSVEGYKPDDLPIVLANFSIHRHDPESPSPKHDFKAYYDLLKNPPSKDDRPYPLSVAKCPGDLRFSVECGCCPPLGTDLD